MSGIDTLFVHRRRISFSDTDAARIAYTGRFPNFALDAIDAWFVERLGADWFVLNEDLGHGTPFVHLHMDFRSPLTPRDELATTVALAKAGRSSLEFAVTGRTVADDRLSFQGRFVCVFVDNASGKSRPIPERFHNAVTREVALAAAA